MRLKSFCEILGSILNFAGGAVLTYEALIVKDKIYSEENVREIQESFRARGLENQVTYKGRPVSKLQEIMAEASLYRAKLGAILMTVGFLLDIAGKLPCDF